MVHQRHRPFQILLVEDNRADIFLMQEAFSESSFANVLNPVQDGEEALQYLRRGSMYADAPRPDVVILDLNLPRKDGREVLEEIKRDKELRLIPVIVLTTSEAESDVVRCYELGANCYLTKPMSVEELFEIVKRIETFWFATVRLPAHNE